MGPNIQNEVVPPAVIAAAEENGSDDSRAGDDNGNAQTEEEPRAAGDTSAQSSKPLLSDVRFLIGEDLRTKEKYYWEFGNKSLNNRHLLINGNSGCGKTYCIQTLLMEMVRAGISGVVFDYTSGFTPDKLDPLFLQELGEKVRQRVVYLDKIPVNPFARQIVKIGGTEGLEKDVSVATRIANVFATVYGFGGQQKSALYKAIKNGFQHHGDGMSFAYLEDELNDVNAKQAETVLSKIQPFLDLEPFAEDEAFSWGSIRDSDGIVYFAFSGFNFYPYITAALISGENEVSEIIQEFFRLVTDENTTGVAIDLRGNSGGVVSDMAILWTAFMPEGADSLRIGDTRRKNSENRTDYTVWSPFIIERCNLFEYGTFSDDVPIAIILNENSVSCAEMSTFAFMSLRDTYGYNVRLFGAHSQGGNGALITDSESKLSEILFNGGITTVAPYITLIYTPYCQSRYINGTNYEGKGIPVDEQVTFSPSDFKTGNDLRLKAALAWLEEQNQN